MTKRQHTEYSHRRELQDAGLTVTKADALHYNHGSETFKHELGKLAAARVLKENNYRICSEVETPDGNEIDVLGYATEDKDCIAVELETSPTDETESVNLEKYVYGLPVRECFTVNIGPMPMHGLEAVEYIADEIGFEV